MSFVPETRRAIAQRMANRIIARSDLADLTSTSQFLHVVMACSREFVMALQALLDLLDSIDLDAAVGEDLDERAKILNSVMITRITGVKATGAVVFSRAGTTGVVTIASGTQVKVPASSGEVDLTYTTTAVGTIPNGSQNSGSVAIEAAETGTDYNVDPNTITGFVGKPSGVDTVANAASITNGRDLETDDEFRTRIKGYIQSLPRCTPSAIEGFILGATDGSKTVQWCQIWEDEWNPGTAILYIDDGSGTAATPATRTAYTVFTATGGEIEFYLADKPIDDSSVGCTFTIDTGGGAVALPVADYDFHYPSGHLKLKDTSIYYPLGAGDIIAGTYGYWTGLIPEVQKIVDGDPADRTNYPGYRAAGVSIAVKAPQVLWISVTCNITVRTGFDQATAVSNVENAIQDYINHLGIGEDVILAELTEQIMSVNGIYDVGFTTPTGNTVISSTKLARTSAALITVT